MSEILYLSLISTHSIACSQRQIHMHMYRVTQLYILSIHRANKAVKHLINSYDYFWRRKQKQSMLVLSVKTSKGGRRGVTLKSIRKDWAEFSVK